MTHLPPGVRPPSRRARRRAARTGPDEFTIPRPRWVVPVAVAGALLLVLGLVVGRLVAMSGGDDAPPARTGATTSLVTTTAPTTTR